MGSWKEWLIHSVIAILQVAAVVGLIAFVVWALVSAGSFNASRAELCEQHGLVFGSEYMGGYGCVELHPFEDFESTAQGLLGGSAR